MDNPNLTCKVWKFLTGRYCGRPAVDFYLDLYKEQVTCWCAEHASYGPSGYPITKEQALVIIFKATEDGFNTQKPSKELL
jgi:hypothetical protein